MDLCFLFFHKKKITALDPKHNYHSNNYLNALSSRPSKDLPLGTTIALPSTTDRRLHLPCKEVIFHVIFPPFFLHLFFHFHVANSGHTQRQLPPFGIRLPVTLPSAAKDITVIASILIALGSCLYHLYRHRGGVGGTVWGRQALLDWCNNSGYDEYNNSGNVMAAAAIAAKKKCDLGVARPLSLM